MKKVILAVLLCFGGAQLAQSQIEGGIKAGINYNSDSFVDVKEDVQFNNAKSKTGYHAGAWVRFSSPSSNLYIRPEVVFTQLNSEVTYEQNGAAARATTYEIKKIDVPVLLGLNFAKVGHVFAGPSFQYILDSDFEIKDLENINSDGFSLGLQLGAGVEFGNFGLDVRWERALSDTEAEFVDNNTNRDVKFDNRINQIIIGLSLKF